MSSTETADEDRASLDLELAGLAYRLVGMPRGWMDQLPDRLLACRSASHGAPQGVLQLRSSDDPALLPTPETHDLNETSSVEFSADRVRYRSDFAAGELRFGPSNRFFLDVHPAGAPFAAGLLENALRLLVAYDILGRGGVLLHSGAMVWEGCAAVVFGHSGAGKSTSCRLALDAGLDVVSDDVNVLQPGEHGWVVRPVPFSGSLGVSTAGAEPIPLSGLFHLNQAAQTGLRACSPARAVALLGGCAPFVNQDPHRADALLDILSCLSRDVCVQELHFTRNPDFLPLLFGPKPEA